MINIKRAVKGNVKFKYFRDDALWYETEHNELFPVPIPEAASATFSDVEKGMHLMRWMRKWNEVSMYKLVGDIKEISFIE